MDCNPRIWWQLLIRPGSREIQNIAELPEFQPPVARFLKSGRL